ncbi:MAG TPA: nitrilase-related carbon-nitrogen hydrolase [Syntrophorhabdaceae bacterium]|nr:nitrilase-related carbon-nitrogen hydrolase [Syntrophorhabdaceae bacterium]HQM81088.1 nitrilase-related carbon-nitrogen hydrolase [Syntrophorhabdaceae bacterium]
MKIAGIQFACSPNKERNTEKALQLLAVAVREDAKFICFQELFNLPWFPKDRDEGVWKYAEKIDGPTIRLFKNALKGTDSVVILPIFERSGKKYFNTSVVFSSDTTIGIYRKLHITDIPLWEEKFYFSPGNRGLPVFQTPHGTIGVQASWDNFYHECTRILTMKGADIIFAPTACAFKSQHIWQTVLAGNAIAHGAYIMRVNRVGSEAMQDFYGMSFCVNPEGELVGGPTGITDSVLLADIDLEYLQHVRREWPILKGRRPACYKEILTEVPWEKNDHFV